MKNYYLFISFLFLSFNLFAQSLTLPFVEDFESGQNGWTSGGTNTTWAFGTPNKLGLSSAPSGSNAWVLGNLTGNHNNNEKSYVQSPVYDFTNITNAKVSATVAYDLESCCDGVQLQYSIDGGTSWTIINASIDAMNWYDDEWNGNTSGTQIVSSNASALAGQPSVIFRFYFDSDGSVIREGFVFDDFTLSEYPDQDLKMHALNKENSRYLTTSETIDVVVYNSGTAPTSSFDLSYTINEGTQQTESYAIAIPASSYDTLSFSATADLSQEGTYDFKIWVSNFAADTIQDNDTISHQLTHYQQLTPSLPYFNDFENYISETGSYSEKVIYNLPEFELKLESEGVYQVFYTILSKAIEGSRYLHMEGRSNTQYLIGHFDFSTSSVSTDNFLLSFIANSTVGANAKVAIRGSRNHPWIEIDSISSREIKTHGYDISSILANNGQDFSSSFQLRFTNNSNYSLNLDNLRIERIEDNDLTVLSQSIQNGRDLGVSEALSVNIFNKGVTDQSSFDISYQMGTNGVVTETINSTIGSIDTLNHTFASTLDLSAIGSYDLKVWTSLATDTNTSNDTLEFQVKNYGRPIVNLPYSLNFDSLSLQVEYGDSMAIDLNNQLDFQTSAYAHGNYRIINDANSIDGNSIGLSSLYSATNELILNLNMSNYLVGNNQIRLTFDYRNIFDGISPEDKIFIRGNNSDTWIPVFDWNTEVYNQNITALVNITEFLATNGQEFSATTQIKFGQSGTSSFGSDGLVLDNISLTEFLADDISLIAHNLQSSRSLTNSDTLIVDIYNNGLNAQQNFDVFYQINGGTVVQETVAATVAGLDTLSYTFTTILDLPSGGDYDIDVWTALTGDMDQSNDTLSFTIEKVSNSVVQFPLMIDFENDSSFFTQGDTILFGSERRFDFFTENGTGEVQVFTQSYAIDNKSLGIASSSQDLNELILNLNLSDYTVEANKILFSFDYKDIGDEDHEADKIYIRGSEADPWIALFHWNTSDEYTTINVSMNISDSLLANGQVFSNSTQIKFSQDDNYSFGTDGLVIDNLNFTELLTEDLSPINTNLQSSRTLTNSETLIIDIHNNGVNSQQNFDVFYQINGGAFVKEIVTDSVAGLDSIRYTFNTALDLLTVGQYDIKVWTGLAGDLDQSNDTLSVSIENYPNPNVQFPLTIDFENDSSFFTQGDTLLFGDERRFDFLTNNKLGQIQVFSGSRAIYMNSLAIASSGLDLNELILNLNLSDYTANTNKILFEFDFRDVNDDDSDEDKVFIRGSKNDPWIVLYDWNTTNENYVLSASMNISDSLLMNGQEFSNSTQIKFGQTGYYELGYDGLVIDNLNFTELANDDVGVISSPLRSMGSLTAADTLKADLHNFGRLAQQGFNIYYQIDNQAPVLEVVTETINPLDTVQYTFDNLIDLSEERVYSIKIWTDLTNDQNNTNDTLSLNIEHYPLVDLPYSENFENGDGNWIASGNNSSWEYGLPSKLGYDSTQNNQAWTLGGLVGQYNNSEQSYLESPLFNLSSIDSGYFSVDINYEIENNFDELRVQYSTNQGDTWNDLNTGTLNWFTGVGWSGTGTNQITAKADISNLTSFGELKFRFYFESDGSVVYKGAIIDNIIIESYPNNDIKTVSQNLVSSRGLTNSEDITVEIYNNGINAQQNFQVSYQVNDGNIVQETVSNTIASLDSLTYTFAAQADLSTVGLYNIDIWTTLSGDENTSNDTLSFTIEKFNNPVVALPLLIDFENDSTFFTQGDTTFFGDEGRFDFFTLNGTGQVQVFTGSNAIMDRSLGIASAIQDLNELILNLNLSNYTVEANKILFNFDYKDLGDEDDTADKVFIRGSENDSWITLYDWNTTNENTIINVSVNISDSLLANGQAFSNTTQIKFGQSDNVELGQDGLVIDNLSFTELSNDDVGVVSTDLVSSGLFTASENLSVGIFNYGKLAQQGFDIYYQIDNGQVIQETVTEIVNPLNTLNYSFGNMLDLSAEKTYQIKVWTDLINDSNQSNDSLTFSIEHFPVIELPYTQDFESGDGDWIAGGNNSSWEYGVPTKLGYDSIQNNKAWALGGLSGDYNNTELSYIESPIFNFTQIDSAYISADINFNLESGYDYLRIQYSTDLGDTWVTLNNGLSNWYTGNGWSSSNEIQALADISALAGFEGVKFRFYFSSDGSYTLSGAIIDNIEVKPYPSVDMTLTDYSFTAANDSLGSAESIDVTVFNLGQEYNNAVIEYSLNNEQVHRDTVNVVGALEVQTITLSNALDFTVQCANQLRISLIVENDVDQTNNILEDLIYTNSNIVENLILEDSMEVCINQAIIQLESEISNGTWTGDGVSESGAFDPLTAGVGVHEILFETFEEGCSNFDSIIINVKEVISGSVDKSVEGQLTAPEAVSYRWFRDRAFINETSQTIEIQKSGNYEVELTNEVGCTSIIEVGQVLGNNTVLNEDHYTVYPNPAREYIMINVIPDLTEVRAQLYSLDGRLIWEKPIIEIQSRMEVNRIYSGTYILKIISNEGIATEKIIVY
ncbi:T9SS type A sorting domain-containing protein [Marivirga sp.]|uniref:T9SS type A sorting domain-containing protein n=1 Tax=Marivirga sp. TaxID=2018662 RepID=UPI0025EE4CF4|nr:T9SS type A sorting domain-containing protein [Marivirga sp.]